MAGEVQGKAVKELCCKQTVVKHLVATEERVGICIACTKANTFYMYKALVLHRQEAKLTLCTIPLNVKLCSEV